ncbi:MAG: hypothetical protein AB9866_17135 [Syntrophobacteraceae bacterium]
MNKLLKIVLGIVVFIAVAVGAVFYFTSDMVSVAEDFFSSVKAGKMTKAYSYLSEDFKANTSEKALTDFLAKNGLNGFKQASWGERSISGNRGHLTGSITTESGGVIPIKMSFVKGEPGWKIFSIEKPAAGVQETATPRQLPTEDEQVKLVAGAMNVFAKAVNEKSMAKFHSYCSNLMQKQLSVSKLDESFGVFYTSGMDLTLLEGYSPAFDEKAMINEDGVLIIKGHYPTKPSHVFFEQKYIYEGLGWKLLGFNINVK